MKDVLLDEFLGYLWRKRIYPYRTSLLEAVRIVVMPHFTHDIIDHFLEIINEAYYALKEEQCDLH